MTTILYLNPGESEPSVEPSFEPTSEAEAEEDPGNAYVEPEPEWMQAKIIWG